MLDNLTQRLSRVVKTLRPDRGQHPGDAARSAHGPAGGRRGAARGARVRRPGQDKALGEEVAGSLSPGQALVGVVPGTDRADGRRPGRRLRRTVAGRAAARRDPDGRPAGRGQDHHHRQAGALAVRGPAHPARPQDRQEESAGGVGRRLPSRRHRAVEGRGRRSAWTSCRPTPARSRGHRPQRGRPRTPPSLRRADPGHGRPPGHRRGHDARDPRAA